MKNRRKPNKNHKTDLSFARFFNPGKSPHLGAYLPFLDGTWYVPKHEKYNGTLVWPSKSKGTYEVAKHGIFKNPRR